MKKQEELAKLEALKTEYEVAQKDYNAGLVRDRNRSDGSPRQDGINDRILKDQKDKLYFAKRAVENQEQLITELD